MLNTEKENWYIFVLAFWMKNKIKFCGKRKKSMWQSIEKYVNVYILGIQYFFYIFWKLVALVANIISKNLEKNNFNLHRNAIYRPHKTQDFKSADTVSRKFKLFKFISYGKSYCGLVVKNIHISSYIIIIGPLLDPIGLYVAHLISVHVLA